MYLVFTCMPGGGYRKRLVSFCVCLCDVLWLIGSPNELKTKTKNITRTKNRSKSLETHLKLSVVRSLLGQRATRD